MKAKTAKRKSAARGSPGAIDSAIASSDLSGGVTTKIQSLAEWLRHDIRRRGLQPGDRYMTSEEAARLLDVSTGTAHQAMRILVEENVLNRRQRQGTYVGPAIELSAIGTRPRVYLLSPSDVTLDAHLSRISEAICPAISRTLGGAALQVEYLPSGDGMRYLRSLVCEAEAEGNLGGFVLLRSTFEIQEFFQELRGRVPAVIGGSAYPGIEDLPWTDADQRQIGKLTAEYALRVGHQRMATLMHEHWAPGDSRFMSGMTESMETLGRRLDCFEICSLPAHDRAIRHQIRELLSRNDRPTIIVARLAFQVSVAFDVAKELGLRIPQDVDIVLGNLGYISPLSRSIPHAESVSSIDEVGQWLGQMLSALRQGHRPEPHQVIYPVQFVERTQIM